MRPVGACMCVRMHACPGAARSPVAGRRIRVFVGSKRFGHTFRACDLEAFAASRHCRRWHRRLWHGDTARCGHRVPAPSCADHDGDRTQHARCDAPAARRSPWQHCPMRDLACSVACTLRTLRSSPARHGCAAPRGAGAGVPQLQPERVGPFVARRRPHPCAHACQDCRDGISTR